MHVSWSQMPDKYFKVWSSLRVKSLCIIRMYWKPLFRISLFSFLVFSLSVRLVCRHWYQLSNSEPLHNIWKTFVENQRSIFKLSKVYHLYMYMHMHIMHVFCQRAPFRSVQIRLGTNHPSFSCTNCMGTTNPLTELVQWIIPLLLPAAT